MGEGRVVVAVGIGRRVRSKLCFSLVVRECELIGVVAKSLSVGNSKYTPRRRGSTRRCNNQSQITPTDSDRDIPALTPSWLYSLRYPYDLVV